MPLFAAGRHLMFEWLHGVSGYSGLFLFCASSGIVFPLPEDVSLLYAGMLLQMGEVHWAPLLLVTMAGVMLRDVIVYWIGRLLGEWLLDKKWTRRILGEKKLKRARKLVTENGSGAVIFGRFLVGFRAPVFFVAGAMGVSFRKFLAWNALGLLVAVPGMIGLGYLFGAPVVDMAFWVVRRGRLVMGMMLIIGILFVWWRVRVLSRGGSAEDRPRTESGGSNQRAADQM